MLPALFVRGRLCLSVFRLCAYKTHGIGRAFRFSCGSRQKRQDGKNKGAGKFTYAGIDG